MKKILSLLTMALIAINASAQEVCALNPNNVLGLDADYGTELAGGTVLGETASIVATIGADDIYRPKPFTFTVNGVSLTGGLQGSTNPKDADGGILPANTLNAPVSGAYLEFEAKADGFLYLIINTPSNKTYTVFEEGTAIGYTFAAIGDASTDLGAVYQFKLVGEGETNEIKYPIERAEQEFLKATDPEKYAAHQTTDTEGNVSWTKIGVSGIGVITFPVFKDRKYIVNGSGSKITAGGYVFSKEDNVTISAGDTFIYTGIVYNYIEKGKVAEVISNPNGKYRGDVIIPVKITHEGVEYTVTKIADGAFYGCSGLTSVKIPNSVTSIGASAFYECSCLTSITIPNCEISIGKDAFYGCTNLASVNISDIEAWCGISFHDGYSNPLYYAHHLYLNGEEITELTIPNSVSSIGGSAFSGCTGLTSINIPNSVSSIGGGAFSGCTGLTSINIPNSVNTINDYSFKDCTGLTSITMPNSVTSIGIYAFAGCIGLESVTIPNYVTSIGRGAFSGCSGLKSLTIGSGVTDIKENAFANCAKLESVYCMAENVPTTATSAFDGSYIDYASLHVPASAINAYKTTAPWSGFGDFKTLSGEAIETKKCATPTISFENGEIIFSCETEGVEYVSNISAPDAKAYYDGRLKPTYKYTVSVYATKAGFDNSEIATAEFSATGVFGDLNGDGKVNVADHVELTKIIMNED